MSDYIRIEDDWSDIVNQVVNEYKARPKETAEERKEEIEELICELPSTMRQAYQNINLGDMSKEDYSTLLAEIKSIKGRNEASDEDIKQVAQMLDLI